MAEISLQIYPGRESIKYLRRMATEVPIFKRKDENDLGKRKPISLTSSVCRSLEQALKKKDKLKTEE